MGERVTKIVVGDRKCLDLVEIVFKKFAKQFFKQTNADRALEILIVVATPPFHFLPNSIGSNFIAMKNMIGDGNNGLPSRVFVFWAGYRR